MSNENVGIWTPDMDLITPIDESQIPGFEEWVHYNGFRNPRREHTGFDFASYLDTNDTCILGLPAETVVRAVRDGVVLVATQTGWPYADHVAVSHGEPGDGFNSEYHHVIPLVENQDIVEKGQPLGTLFHQKREGSRPEQLIHLHFEMANAFDTLSVRDRYTHKGVKRRYVNPAGTLFPSRDLPPWGDYRQGAIKSQATLSDMHYFPERL